MVYDLDVNFEIPSNYTEEQRKFIYKIVEVINTASITLKNLNNEELQQNLINFVEESKDDEFNFVTN